MYGEKFNKPKYRFREIKEYKPKKYIHTHTHVYCACTNTHAYVYYNVYLSARAMCENLFKLVPKK